MKKSFLQLIAIVFIYHQLSLYAQHTSKDYEFDKKIIIQFLLDKKDWEFLTYSGNNKVYFLTSSIAKKGNTFFVISIWESSDREFHSDNKVGLSTNSIFNGKLFSKNHITHTIYLEEYDCVRNMNRIIQMITYNRKGEVLDEMNFSELNNENDFWIKAENNSVEKK